MDVAAIHDVVVLGAGPGGTAAAIRLAGMGLDVAIVERHAFPRDQVGICIAGETLALIDHLGVRVQFDAASFWNRQVTAVKWGEEGARFVSQPGYHVCRGVLDGLLLRKAGQAGVRVYQPSRVESVERCRSGEWRIAVAESSALGTIAARYLVDASGRQPVLRAPRLKDGPPLLCVHATWSLAKAAEYDGLIEAGEDGWLWYAQTGPDRAVVSMFLDPRRFPERACLTVGYLSGLKRFGLIRLETFKELCSSPSACDATSRHASDPIGSGYIRVGDACIAVDPLSSQGVHLALQSGLQGAVVVNTIVRRPENEGFAQKFYRARVAERVQRFTEQTRREYARMAAFSSGEFWRERAFGSLHGLNDQDPQEVGSSAMPADKVAVSPTAMFELGPVIDGDFVEMRRVVNHPRLGGGVAYLEGVDLHGLLTLVPASIDYANLPMLWRGLVSPAIGARIARWLWDRHVLIGAS